MSETAVGFLRLRTDDRGMFDELVGTAGVIHFEMMNDGHLWVGIDHPTDPTQSVMVNVWVEGKKLGVRVEDDSEAQEPSNG